VALAFYHRLAVQAMAWIITIAALMTAVVLIANTAVLPFGVPPRWGFPPYGSV
jgi:hypothetical protein